MKTRHGLLSVIAMSLTLIAFAASHGAAAEAFEQEAMVDKARLTFEAFINDPNMPWLRDNIKDAKGLLIFPQVLKGAFFVGGSGGSGVLVVRDDKTGQWSQPAFYTIGSASFGLQFGAQASEVVLMVTTSKGLESLYNSSVKLGADAAVAAGPVGARAEGAVPINFSATYVSFARSKGVFLGISLDGSVISVRDSWNREYYGKQVRPINIIVEQSVSNPQSAGLRDALAKASK